MTRRVGIIPKAPMARILLNAGAKRVSADGTEAFVDVISNITEEIAKRAVMIAKHSGRKTVQEEDIKISAKQYSKNLNV